MQNMQKNMQKYAKKYAKICNNMVKYANEN